MSRTTEWMRDWISEGGKRRTQLELARMAGLNPANISRWLSHQTKPDQEAIDAIAACLSEQDALGLTRAWLQDHTPARLVRRVEVTATTTTTTVPPARPGREEEGAGGYPAGMSRPLKEKLHFIGGLAMTHPDVRRIIDVLHDLAQRLSAAAEAAKELSNLKSR
jgi:transcriptional regulator with XRE-family HTH domain